MANESQKLTADVPLRAGFAHDAGHDASATLSLLGHVALGPQTPGRTTHEQGLADRRVGHGPFFEAVTDFYLFGGRLKTVPEFPERLANHVTFVRSRWNTKRQVRSESHPSHNYLHLSPSEAGVRITVMMGHH